MKLELNAIGHLGHSATVKHLDGGQAVINFSIACTEKWKDKNGQKQERTTWVDCTLWRKPDKTGIAECLKRGTLVSVSGRPDVRAWNGKEHGDARAVLQLRVDDLILLGNRTEANTSANTNENKQTDVADESQGFTASAQEDDLPF